MPSSCRHCDSFERNPADWFFDRLRLHVLCLTPTNANTGDFALKLSAAAPNIEHGRLYPVRADRPAKGMATGGEKAKVIEQAVSGVNIGKLVIPFSDKTKPETGRSQSDSSRAIPESRPVDMLAELWRYLQNDESGIFDWDDADHRRIRAASFPRDLEINLYIALVEQERAVEAADVILVGDDRRLALANLNGS
ncbi:uncharacterized protein RHO25_002250 [Cercospora beticola]|uniref:Uncharacterized protein n=1 Tax=Cercospora beticola TaxID=122368 RepID=A0ABZ0NDM7_CERBT|nr:hypothetical protein RHO25_002250 [Cercospora beticola]